MLGLSGLCALYLLSWFIPSFQTTNAYMAYSALGILIFSGLTAYDIQKIKQTIAEEDFSTVTAIHGALDLYLDFFNLFMDLLTLFGRKR